MRAKSQVYSIASRMSENVADRDGNNAMQANERAIDLDDAGTQLLVDMDVDFLIDTE